MYVVISAHYCYVSNKYENVFGYVCYLNNKKIYEGNYANGNFLDLRYVKHARTRCYVRQYWKGSTISSLVSFQTFNEELGQKDTKFVLWTSSFFEYLLSQILLHQDIFTSLNSKVSYHFWFWRCLLSLSLLITEIYICIL